MIFKSIEESISVIRSEKLLLVPYIIYFLLSSILLNMLNFDLSQITMSENQNFSEMMGYISRVFPFFLILSVLEVMVVLIVLFLTKALYKQPDSELDFSGFIFQAIHITPRVVGTYLCLYAPLIMVTFGIIFLFSFLPILVFLLLSLLLFPVIILHHFVPIYLIDSNSFNFVAIKSMFLFIKQRYVYFLRWFFVFISSWLLYTFINMVISSLDSAVSLTVISLFSGVVFTFIFVFSYIYFLRVKKIEVLSEQEYIQDDSV
ncbi:hypothetical protein DID76_03000 [Candidatus Marinamargulisbacteria bacterium SCGC AG-414-C22]|nr:hypothetical protein DID76_03000 [Candidatus Marinamargulisbacteria bacterium SCGC AG-414-C22]